MDVLEKFNESKEAIVVIEKTLFDMFESNDPYSIISQSDLTYLDLTDHKEDKSKLLVNIYNFKDVSPRITFESPRSNALSCDESMIKLWLNKSKEIIIGANIMKCKRFLREFESTDHDLIAHLITTHKKCKDLHPDSRIAEFAAKDFTNKLI